MFFGRFFSAILQGWVMRHLNIITRTRIHIHKTHFTNPSPCSRSDGTSGASFISQAWWRRWGDETQTFMYIRNKTHSYKNYSILWKYTVSFPWRTFSRVKGDSSTRQSAFTNPSRSFHQNIKDFFKKLFIFLKKSCQVFYNLFFKKQTIIFGLYYKLDYICKQESEKER